MNKYFRYLLLVIMLVTPGYLLAHDQITNLVTPVSYFINHVKQLGLLKHNLDKYKKASLTGTSGIGKTQLARTYAYENKSKYNLIWFIDCNLDFNQEFVRLAQQLNKVADAKLIEEAPWATKAVIDYLTQHQQWLLVLDNLKVNQNNLVKRFVDWEHNGQVMFCSQDSEGLPHAIEMTKFSHEDTAALAKNILESQDSSSVDFLTTAFDGYPVLIVQGAQLLNTVKGLDKQEYRHKIYQSSDKIKLNISLATKELKPSAAKLISKIALLNNQKFSKELIGVITDSPATVDDDIYQLSKFALIVNVDANENNPIFEMHDVVAQKISEINQVNNRALLEEMILKITDYYRQLGRTTQSRHVMRTTSTIMPANLEVILRNAAKYQVSANSELRLRVDILVRYINSQNRYGSEQMVDWFNEQEKNSKFSSMWGNKIDQRGYAGYLGLIGNYHRNILSHLRPAVGYFTRALEILEKMDNQEIIHLKYNHLSHLTAIQALLGNIAEAQIALTKMTELLAQNIGQNTGQNHDAMLHHAKTAICQVRGEHLEALKYANKIIDEAIEQGMSPNDLFLTVTYKMRAESLNWAGKYQQAGAAAQQLYDMHSPVKGPDHTIFGFIYTQMARSALGLGQIKPALEQVKKAISILLADERRNPKNAHFSQDPDLASAYLVQGDILAADGDLKTATESYRQAQAIYFYLYKENRRNVAHVSYLYTQGAKAACKAHDLYHYRCFGQPQIEEFGINHPGTAQMLKYCQQYNMNTSLQDH